MYNQTWSQPCHLKLGSFIIVEVKHQKHSLKDWSDRKIFLNTYKTINADQAKVAENDKVFQEREIENLNLNKVAKKLAKHEKETPTKILGIFKRNEQIVKEEKTISKLKAKHYRALKGK